MKTSHVICLSVLIAFILTATAAAQNLELAIAADKTSFALGEPVILFVTLQNNGPVAADVLLPLDLESGFVVFRITSPDGKEAPFVPWAHGESASPVERLTTGQSVSAEAKLFFGRNGWTFIQPGVYTLRASYLEKVLSNTLSIRINQPSDNAQKRAAEAFLGSEEAGYFLLFEGGDHLKAGIRLVQKVAENYPDTPHAAYANLALGKNLVQDFANFQEKRLRPADPARAVIYLELSKAQTVSLYQAMHTRAVLAQAFTKLGYSGRVESIRQELDILISDRFSHMQPLIIEIMKRKFEPLR